MTGGGPLRAGLLLHASAPESSERAVAAVEVSLRAAGHEAVLIRPRPLLEAPLRKRGFTGPLTHVPAAVAALARGRFDLVHAFSAADAGAALLWRRRTGRPVAFALCHELDRGNVADRRLRLQLLTAAIEDTDAVTVTTESARDALWRWMAVEAPLLDPRDGAAHERLYRALLARPAA